MGSALLLALTYFLATTVYMFSAVSVDLPAVDAKARHTRQVDPRLTSRTFDLSNRCPPGVFLGIGNKQLNVPNLRISFSEAAQVSSILYGQSLEERVDVLCRRVQRAQQAAFSLGRPIPRFFDVRRTGLFEGDILLDSETAFKFLSGPISLSPNPRPVVAGQRLRPNPTPTLSNFGTNPAPNNFRLSPRQLSPSNPISPIIQRAQPLPSPLQNPRPVFLSNPRAIPLPNPIPIGGSPVAVIPGTPTRNGFIAPSRTAHSQRRNNRQKRKITRSGRWPGGVVPFRFRSGDFNQAEKQGILNAIASWESKTCIRMPETTDVNLQNSVVFIKDTGNGCYSYVGLIRSKQQQISIDDGCNHLGIIAHEIGHALGLAHEQSRPDRDNYVTIDTTSVHNSVLNNFEKRNWDFYETAKVPYDYASVMHYGLTDFSESSPRTPTTIPRDSDWRQGLGQRNDVSFWDAKIVNLLYCNNKCGGTSLESSACLNGGYVDPNNCGQCVCPPGFAPPTCSTPPVPAAGCGNTALLASSTLQTFSSPNYDAGTGPTNTDCYYVIQAPVNQRVRMSFVDQFEIQRNTRACDAFVEVRYQTMSLNGPRFCDTTRPVGDFVSHGQKILLTLSTKADSSKGFKIQYQSESCGGCSGSNTASEPACLVTNVNLCVSQNNVLDNRCFDPLPTSQAKFYCCSGYTLSQQTCTNNSPPPPTIAPPTPTPTVAPPTPTPTVAPPTPTPTVAPPTPTPTVAPPTPTPTVAPPTPTPTVAPPTPTPTVAPPTPTPTVAPPTPTPTVAPPTPTPNPEPWGPWTPWSTCSKTCGLCGVQYRSRVCVTSPCSGPTSEVRPCAEKACLVGGLFICFNGSVYTICNTRPGGPKCCIGFNVGDKCFLNPPAGNDRRA